MRNKTVIMIAMTTASIVFALGRNVSASGHDTFKMTVLYNNVQFNQRLTTGWGFSCFIAGKGKNILFDAGGSGTVLLQNMERLKIEPGAG